MGRRLALIACALELALLVPRASYAADPKVTAAGPPSCNAPGRYVLVQHSSVRADQFLLDTCLGRVWQRVSYTDIEADIWQIMPRADSEDELLQWSVEQLSRSGKGKK